MQGGTMTQRSCGEADRAATEPVMNLIGVGSVLAVSSLLTHQQHWELTAH